MSASDNQLPTAESHTTDSLQRFFLQRLVQFTETITATCPPEAVIHLPITLIIEGQVLAGDMISYAEYIKKSLRSIETVFRHAIKQSGAAPPAALSQLDEEIRTLESSQPLSPRGYLWLKNVRGNWSAAKEPIVPEPAVEIAIDRISVFWLGHGV